MDDNVMEDEDPKRFKEARGGDHLITPFQCDGCHFGNVYGRPPNSERSGDQLGLMCIRRANLDALWSRERSTVNANRREGIRAAATADMFGFKDPHEFKASHPEEDSMGMRIAMLILNRSMDTGKNAATVQFNTIRRLRSHFSNFYHSRPGGVGATTMRGEEGTATESNSVTNSYWFRRFMVGCHKRMGDVWIPDRPVSIQELKCCLKILEEELVESVQLKDYEGQRQVCLTATMLIFGYFGGLRGEEIVRTDLGSMREHLREALDFPEASHVPLMLAGRFKGELGEKLFCQPLAVKTNSGIDIATWTQHTIRIMEHYNVVKGPLFRTATGKGKSRRATVGDLDPLLHAVLRKVQTRWPNVISDSTNIEEDYSLFRSLRRGATAHAQNCRIPKEVIEANNRWRKHARSRGTLPGMSMMERYTDAKASVPSLIRFSESM